jgi:hypothetical protein
MDLRQGTRGPLPVSKQRPSLGRDVAEHRASRHVSEGGNGVGDRDDALGRFARVVVFRWKSHLIFWRLRG